MSNADHTDALTSGYSIVDGLFDRAEVAGVLDALARAPIARTKAGARHALGIPAVRDLAYDARLLDLAAPVVGPSAVPFRATLFDKSQASNWLVPWHQDTALPLCARVDDPEWGPWSRKGGVLYGNAPAYALESVVALRVQLDDSTSSNGPLRVLPCTHDRGILTGVEIDRLSKQVPAVDCVVGAGGVVAMRPLIVHASSKATDGLPRRVLHLEYASTLRLGTGVELAVG